ncbi:MAG TPA: hypothetical protein PKC18_05915 [Lacipirellulaceae bacterium]|nr:hypothetical protein [Lacipirellulaceae bacterium]
MSHLRVECGGCRAVLTVRAELAGQQGRCPKCGGAVTIPTQAALAGWTSYPSGIAESGATAAPAAAVAPAPVAAAPTATTPAAPARPTPAAAGGSLAQATAVDMMAELGRRHKSAVLVVFDTPADGQYEISRRSDANVRCYRTSDMNESQLLAVLGELGAMAPGPRNQKGGVALRTGPAEPFEFKGDRLGMSLGDFKLKHARKVGSMSLPFCSDAMPGQANASLWSEPWHAAAGLVTARVELPSENASPTVAGVKSDLALYHFVDGKLFRITVLFDTEAFHLVREALVAKQGPPTSETKDPLELAWSNDLATIHLVRGSMRPKKSSSLIYVHHDLQRLAESRTPQRTTDL